MNPSFRKTTCYESCGRPNMQSRSIAAARVERVLLIGKDSPANSCTPHRGAYRPAGRSRTNEAPSRRLPGDRRGVPASRDRHSMTSASISPPLPHSSPTRRSLGGALRSSSDLPNHLPESPTAFQDLRRRLLMPLAVSSGASNRALRGPLAAPSGASGGASRASHGASKKVILEGNLVSNAPG